MSWHRLKRGFTLIELIAVVIILGVVAAAALPRFVDLSKAARIATLDAALGAVASAVQTAHIVCMINEGCYSEVASVGERLPIGPNGLVGTMYYGYPTGLSRVPNFFGLKDWVTLGGGLTLYEVSPGVAEIRIDSAPDPTNCKVRYSVATSHGASPSITTLVSGC